MKGRTNRRGNTTIGLRSEPLEPRRLLAGTCESSPVSENQAACLHIADASASEGNRIRFVATLEGDVPTGFQVDFLITDVTAIGGESLQGGNDFYNHLRPIRFEGVSGESHEFSVATWNDHSAENDEELRIDVSVDSDAVEGPDHVIGKIVDFMSLIELPGGETFVTNEDGVVRVKNGENLLFEADRSDVTKLKFVGDHHDSILAVGDLGRYMGTQALVEFDAGGGTDEFRMLDSIATLDLETPLFELHRVEHVDISSGAAIRVSAETAARVSPDSPLSIRIGTETVLRPGEDWNGSGRYLTERGVAFDYSSGDDTVQLVIENAWHNPLMAEDVNGDSDVSEVDAFTIINDLFRLGTRELAMPGRQTELPSRYLDVSGDGHVSAVDALRVINHLSRVAPAPAEDEVTLYAIGNSLTYDAQVMSIPGTVGFHLRGGTNLAQHSDPMNYPPDDVGIGPWNEVLADQSFDLVVIQPHGGYVSTTETFSSIDTDVAFIRNIRALQPDATIAIYETWPMLRSGNQNDFLNWYSGTGNDFTYRNSTYWDRLSRELTDVPHVRLQVGQMTVDFSDPSVLYSSDGNHFESGSGDYLAMASFQYLKDGTFPSDEFGLNLTRRQIDEVKRLVSSRIEPASREADSSVLRLVQSENETVEI